MAAAGVAIVGHDAFDRDAMVCEAGERTLAEGGRVLLAFAREDLRVGEAGGVLDGHMDEVPSGAFDAVAPVAGDAMAGPDDAAGRSAWRLNLGVDVDELPGVLALVADDRRLRIAVDRRPRPSRRMTPPTVARLRPSGQAMASPVSRSRRRRSMTAIVSAGTAGASRQASSAGP